MKFFGLVTQCDRLPLNQCPVDPIFPSSSLIAQCDENGELGSVLGGDDAHCGELQNALHDDARPLDEGADDGFLCRDRQGEGFQATHPRLVDPPAMAEKASVKTCAPQKIKNKRHVWKSLR